MACSSGDPGSIPVADAPTIKVLVYDPAGPAEDKRFPGHPLVLGGEIDPFARHAGWASGLRFIPA